jgi:hypothetical protein
MQTPMPAAFMGQCKTVTAFLRRVLLRVEALVDHDPALIEEDRTKNVGVALGITRNTEQLVRVVEVDAELEVLLDDILDGNRRDDGYAPGPRV